MSNAPYGNFHFRGVHETNTAIKGYNGLAKEIVLSSSLTVQPYTSRYNIGHQLIDTFSHGIVMALGHALSRKPEQTLSSHPTPISKRTAIVSEKQTKQSFHVLHSNQLGWCMNPSLQRLCKGINVHINKIIFIVLYPECYQVFRPPSIFINNNHADCHYHCIHVSKRT